MTLVELSYAEHFVQAPGMYASAVDVDKVAETTRVLAGWADPDHNTVSFVVSDPYSKQFLANAGVGRRASLVAVTLGDLVAFQYKGNIIKAQSADEFALKQVEAYVARFCELVTHVGIDPVRYPVGFVSGPYTTITLEVDAVFDQTPRVGAGAVISQKEGPQ